LGKATHIDELRSLSVLEGLTDDQLAELARRGTEVRVEAGADVFREGEHADFWWVLLDGAIDLVRHVGREDAVVGHMDVPGRWAGGFRAWDEHGVYLATGWARTDARVLRVPAEVLRELIAAWFPLGGHLIRGLYGTARSIESTARQRESLVTLGTLAAGLAHEINNPASAATRAADDLEAACQTLLTCLRRLAQSEISAEQFIALDALRREIEPQAAGLAPLALADREDALSSWLTRHGVTRDWIIAPPLAAAGVDLAWCERMAALLEGSALEAGLEWVASAFSITALLSEVMDSTRRISDLVAAVRSYSQMDRASIQHIDVTDGLESTLVMLGYKLRDGVTVVRDYEPDVPRIDAYAGELNQVWTILIDNAVDAMDGAGTLRVATRADEGDVVIEIGDTGPGMTPEVAARAFEPFYTTKEVGKGSGLGLDIAQRIVVERHRGTITIDSRPGETVLLVRIPALMTRDRPRPGGLPGLPRWPPGARPDVESRTAAPTSCWARVRATGQHEGENRCRICGCTTSPCRSTAMSPGPGRAWTTRLVWMVSGCMNGCSPPGPPASSAGWTVARRASTTTSSRGARSASAPASWAAICSAPSAGPGRTSSGPAGGVTTPRTTSRCLCSPTTRVRPSRWRAVPHSIS
jgi:signal transduction histidine kinase